MGNLEPIGCPASDSTVECVFFTVFKCSEILRIHQPHIGWSAECHHQDASAFQVVP